MSDVDFFVNDICEGTKHKLELKENEGMYPPRFHVVLSCSVSARESQTRIEFRGAVTELVFDVLLTPAVTSTSTSPSKYPTVYGCSKAFFCLFDSNQFCTVSSLTYFHTFDSASIEDAQENTTFGMYYMECKGIITYMTIIC